MGKELRIVENSGKRISVLSKAIDRNELNPSKSGGHPLDLDLSMREQRLQVRYHKIAEDRFFSGWSAFAFRLG
jgi:hypothetical protein